MFDHIHMFLPTDSSAQISSIRFIKVSNVDIITCFVSEGGAVEVTFTCLDGAAIDDDGGLVDEARCKDGRRKIETEEEK